MAKKLKTRKINKSSHRLEWVEAGSLTKNPLNWKKHPVEQVRALKELIKDPEIGWAGLLVYNEQTGRLLDGHARLQAVGPKELVPVLVISRSEEAEKKILLTFDTVGRLSVADEVKLRALVDDVPLDTKALEVLGDNLAEQLEEMDAAVDADGLRSRGGGSGEGNADVEEQFKIVVNCRNEKHQATLSRKFEKMGLDFGLKIA